MQPLLDWQEEGLKLKVADILQRYNSNLSIWMQSLKTLDLQNLSLLM